MTNEEIAEILAEELRTNVDLRRKFKMVEGDDSGLIDGEPAVGLTDGDGVEHFLSVESA